MYIKYVHVLACCWLLLVVSYFSLHSQFCSLLGFIFGFILGLSWSCLKMVMPQVVSFFNGKMVVSRWISGFSPKKSQTVWSLGVPNELHHVTTVFFGKLLGLPTKMMNYNILHWVYRINYWVYRIRFYLSFINLQWVNYGVSHMYY